MTGIFASKVIIVWENVRICKHGDDLMTIDKAKKSVLYTPLLNMPFLADQGNKEGEIATEEREKLLYRYRVLMSGHDTLALARP